MPSRSPSLSRVKREPESEDERRSESRSAKRHKRSRSPETAARRKRSPEESRRKRSPSDDRRRREPKRERSGSPPRRREDRGPPTASRDQSRGSGDSAWGGRGPREGGREAWGPEGGPRGPRGGPDGAWGGPPPQGGPRGPRGGPEEAWGGPPPKPQDGRWEESEGASRDQAERSLNDRKRKEERKRREREEEKGSSEFTWGKPGQSEPKKEEEEEPIEKEKPNFGTSGKLAEDTNKFNGVVVGYNEPPEARKPKLRWRLYPFKEEEALPVLYVHRQSAYLIGRDRRVVDIPVDHPSCSKQHAALQYRLVKGSVRPYLIDLGSANNTFLNNNKMEPQRYYELQERDVLKFGFSSREYVVLNERSDGAEEEEGATP